MYIYIYICTHTYIYIFTPSPPPLRAAGFPSPTRLHFFFFSNKKKRFNGAGDGGDTGLGSEWHTGAMARGLFLARFVWKSGFPSPPSRIFTYGGGGEGGAGPGRDGGEGRPCPSPTPRSSPPSRPGHSLEGDTAPAPPGHSRCFSPQSQVIDQFSRRSSGRNVQYPAVARSGPGSGHKISFYFPISQRLSLSQGLSLSETLV